MEFMGWILRLAFLISVSSASCEECSVEDDGPARYASSVLQINLQINSSSTHQASTEHISSDSRSSTPPVIAFLRVQKVAGTTFGQNIGTKMAEKHQQKFNGLLHLNYNQAIAIAPDAVVTLLRDPLERLVSEFQMFRDVDACVGCLDQDQWDWHPDDIEWMHRVRDMQNVTEAFQEYVRSPNNPSRNRQTLYLLGFPRAPCIKRECYFPEPAELKGYPAHEYDWDKDHDTLLARAKSHLMSLRSFGITDCFLDSMEVFAQALGWDPKETRALAEAVHTRSAAEGDKLSLERQLGLQPESAHLALLQYKSLAQQLSEEILQINRLDVELLEFARQQWYNLHASKCEKKD
eukprot:TRINITY_DN76526_c0_g1_i1.p1 TRINITY_DN76526_c0_g1~~TRINITY_DN76526_c0_g1_i1.p1  ORF type:complete len:349 (-),score=51.96 TRINITY_DN76526_c0_g1_i1:49-1095(-)